MTNGQNNEATTNADDAAREVAPKKPVVIDVTETDQHASDEGADASKMTDGRGSSGGGMCGPVFQEFMTKAVEKYGGGRFEIPAGGRFIPPRRLRAPIAPFAGRSRAP